MLSPISQFPPSTLGPLIHIHFHIHELQQIITSQVGRLQGRNVSQTRRAMSRFACAICAMPAGLPLVAHTCDVCIMRFCGCTSADHGIPHAARAAERASQTCARRMVQYAAEIVTVWTRPTVAMGAIKLYADHATTGAEDVALSVYRTS